MLKRMVRAVVRGENGMNNWYNGGHCGVTMGWVTGRFKQPRQDAR